MWTDFDGEAEAAAANGVNGQAPTASKDYQDIIVSVFSALGEVLR